MEPKYYKQYFMKPFNFTNLDNVLTNKYYEKVDPLEYNIVLNQMGRAHSQDMSKGDCFTFDSCNYTSFYSRIEHWKCDENTQEHIYKTSSSNNAFKAVNRLVCRSSQNCLNDDDPDVGDFRDRIMGKQIFYSGTGIVYNTTLKTWFYTMDFTQGSCSPQSKDDKSIISASHTFKYENDKEVLFLANFFNSNETIQSFRIYLNQMNYKMNILYSSDSSKTSNGVYSYNTRIFSPCDYYYFKVITNSGKQIRYPTTGYLRIVDNQEKLLWNSNNNQGKLKANALN
ncbi:hypothetical protein DICPUDRAFT_156262 [Dictyostelium purpureum]|uniref:SCP domain-containing protein n=1 Tax=Dictyostelium purpureum TaxID=5786 RepID=F0ZW49_DICPU|nr:uncharacterized protein DICPUDRAFT_156262 [Dictyostelium purpureum]EGC31838.1 hypothetical protein DICPUDRAFT_156262 [Dictyostelium purpureum]|eukprot:XP_003291639.1 hypothetical protein DICPUDRAFT_156262 [Dictyostelium purpureum]